MNIKQVNNLTWSETLRLFVEKFNHEKEVGRLSKDPCPDFPSETLATFYVRKFNEHFRIGWRMELGGGNPFCELRYQTETRLPVLSITYYEDGTAYCERYRFAADGSRVRTRAEYPVSEFGLDYLPERPSVSELIRIKKLLPKMLTEISEALKDN